MRTQHVAVVDGAIETHPPQISTRVLGPPARYVEDHHGRDALRTLCEDVGIDVDDLAEGKRWISLRQLHDFLEGLRHQVPDDDTFLAACRHEMAEGYGPLRFAFFATTPQAIIALAARAIGMVTNVGRCEVLETSDNHVRVLYRSTAPKEETALVCLARQAQSSGLPTFFGFPPATVEQPRCLARGDDCCEYVFSFYSRPRWLPAALSALTGALVAALTTELAPARLVIWPAPLAIWIAMPLLFALLAMLRELQHTHRSNLARAEALQQALRDVATQEAESRSEVFELHQRQKHWAQLMEEQVAERTAALRDVVGGIRTLGERRVSDIRGFSHDLRNPLAVIRAGIDLTLRHRTFDEDLAEDCRLAVDQMEKLLEELIDTAKTDSALVRVTPVVLEVEPLVDRLRRRQQALVFGRDIRVSAARTPEAPKRIRTDPLIFERVVDNLFTNAAKYTERGSIVVELGGRPGYLTLRVSDTGRGIAPQRLETIFSGNDDAATRADHSLGIGLSIVVQLMALIGGKLEVRSRPNEGTTFWAHFPEDVTPSPPGRVELAEVVSVRAATTE